MSCRLAHHGHRSSGCRMGVKTLKIAPDLARSGAGQYAAANDTAAACELLNEPQGLS
jgi:hypothetical protein